ncbi:hypothetical protein SO802_003776 [Lithocarpus litseifolius]|uniref:RNase H type-1 domain-containing protein n=1 Tax=Lithocarpus litseifolius TaxID=425828 RepID=A0AAW2E1L3_9ROSI
MEIIVVIKALRFALDLVALLNEDPSLVDYDHLVDEAKVLVQEFLEIDFNHVMRQSNSATHNNARHARRVSELTVWMEDILPHFSTVIQVDSAIS